MIEALLVVWLSAADKSQTMAIEKFDTMIECQAAKTAMLKKYDIINKPWYDVRKIDPSEIDCIEVK